jgi:hypothetical protein
MTPQRQSPQRCEALRRRLGRIPDVLGARRAKQAYHVSSRHFQFIPELGQQGTLSSRFTQTYREGLTASIPPVLSSRLSSAVIVISRMAP